jgi:hypothetical protein
MLSTAFWMQTQTTKDLITRKPVLRRLQKANEMLQLPKYRQVRQHYGRNGPRSASRVFLVLAKTSSKTTMNHPSRPCIIEHGTDTDRRRICGQQGTILRPRYRAPRPKNVEI